MVWENTEARWGPRKHTHRPGAVRKQSMESSLDRIASAFLLPSLKRVLPTFLLSTAYNSVRTESSPSRPSSRHVFVRVSELHSFDYLVYHRQLTDTLHSQRLKDSQTSCNFHQILSTRPGVSFQTEKPEILTRVAPVIAIFWLTF